MNKTELIDEIVKKTGVSKKDSSAVVNAVFEAITEDLQKGNKTTLIGFGTFETRKRAARTGRNPQTGAEIKIPASKTPAFKPGKALKEAVNKK